MEVRNKKGQFIKGHKVGLGNKYRVGIPAWNKGLNKTNSNTKGGRSFGAKDKKKRSSTNYRLSRLGDKNPMFGKHPKNWKGGVCTDRGRSENVLWRKSIFVRDNFTCQKTGMKGRLLNVHHINNYADFPELRFAIDNGVTLSEKAHKEFHKLYGLRHNTKEQLQEFLTKSND